MCECWATRLYPDRVRSTCKLHLSAFTVVFYGLHTRGIMDHMLIIIFELMDDNFLSINVILSA